MIISFAGFSQRTSTTLEGRVYDQNNTPLPGINVMIENTTIGAGTDIEGRFEIKNLSSGSYNVIISGIGYKKETHSVTIGSNTPATLNVTLQEDTKQMKEVVVYGKSEATLVREQAYAVSVVEAKGLKNSSVDVNQILSRVSGVNIRQNGGMGSSFNLSLNGLSGNRVRTFINGVPMDYFGSSLSLNNFPANLISSIEIYKGAVPIHLSSDALGGSINIITKTNPINFLDASYSHGSFNTHIGAVNGQWHHKKTGITFRLRSFYNHSDNSYPIDIRLLQENGKLDDNYTEIRRFHDAYTSRMAWLEGGVMNKPWADELMAGVVLSDNYKELQQAPYATGISSFPVGEATDESDIKIFNLLYQKKNLITDNLNLRGYLVYSDANRESKDISPHQYDWYGNYESNDHPTTGELGRKSQLFLNTKNTLANVNAEYGIADFHNVSVNYSLNRVELVGHDNYQPQNNTQFSTPNTVTKQVVGLAYTNKAFNERLSTTIFGKAYMYNLKSNNADYQGDETNAFKSSEQKSGFGLATTYFLSDAVQLKTSYERAYRFPESVEMYGDGLNSIPNPELVPEESDNYNLGVRVTSKPPGLYVGEINAFVRDSRNYIRFEPKMNRSLYVNDKQVLASGVDVSMNYRVMKKLTVGVGGTYLDLRNNDKTTSLYQDRLPNEPYLFGNVILTYQMRNVFGLDNQISITNTNRYVHDFYLKWPSVAASGKAEIPSRLTNDLQMTYSQHNGRYNFSFLVTNVFDVKVVDNYNQQNPGRSFNIKLRYFISNTL